MYVNGILICYKSICTKYQFYVIVNTNYDKYLNIKKLKKK